jgi:ABC-type Fe3+ transport system permease subunit
MFTFVLALFYVHFAVSSFRNRHRRHQRRYDRRENELGRSLFHVLVNVLLTVVAAVAVAETIQNAKGRSFHPQIQVIVGLSAVPVAVAVVPLAGVVAGFGLVDGVRYPTGNFHEQQPVDPRRHLAVVEH